MVFGRIYTSKAVKGLIKREKILEVDYKSF